MSELSNFQKNFLAGSGHVEVFTQKEFDEALTLAKAEIMTVAIQTTKQAILIEREECAKLADECVDIEKLGDAIRNRIPAQRQ
jgi:thiazole synthase ThiGH ThiG subunit